MRRLLVCLTGIKDERGKRGGGRERGLPELRSNNYVQSLISVLDNDIVKPRKPFEWKFGVGL